MIKLLLFVLFFSSFNSNAVAGKSDTILNWVEAQSKLPLSEVERSWNPGFLALDETEIRLGFGNNKERSKQTIRFSLKPLFGLNNEYKLSNHRSKLLNLKIQNAKQEQRLYAYVQVLDLWRLQKSLKAIKKSRKVFEKSHRLLSSNRMDKRLESSSTKAVLSLSNYMGMKATIEKAYEERLSHLTSEYDDPKKLLKSVKKSHFLKFTKIQEKLSDNKSESVAINLELAESDLSYFEFRQKKKEAYQLIKFVSVEREEDKNNDAYTGQISIRIPFLSDSEELRRAKTDYIVAQNNLARTQAKEKSELSGIKSEIFGLIDKSNLLKLLPKKSYALQMMNNDMTSVFDATDSEFDFLKAKIDSIETKAKIYEQYLFYLAKLGELNNANKNYLMDL